MSSGSTRTAERTTGTRVRSSCGPTRIRHTSTSSSKDCLCQLKGQTSTGIYYWKDDALVISAPRPGARRPTRFNDRSGDMMRLEKMLDE